MTDVTADSGQTPLDAPLRGASFGQAFSRFFKKYATFHGRASRSEFWWWFLANAIIGGILYGIGFTVGNPMAVNENGVPMVAYNARPAPLHDLGAGDARTVARALVAPPARHEPPGSVVVHRTHPVGRLDHPARLLPAASRPGGRALRSLTRRRENDGCPVAREPRGIRVFR